MGSREGPESGKGRWSGGGSGSPDGKERNTKVGPRLGTRRTPPCHWEHMQRVGLEELVLGSRSEKGGRGEVDKLRKVTWSCLGSAGAARNCGGGVLCGEVVFMWLS